MAVDADLIGVAMTNSEAIMVPTYGRRAMLGTNPIAFAMPADPVPFVFDASTTVIPRGKLEVYKKRGSDVPIGLIIDENGEDCTDPARVLTNIIAKTGGGILPLGGSGKATSGYKGYGFGMICELCTAILSGGATSNYIYKTPGRSNICHSFWAVDYGMFGDKDQIKNNLSKLLQEIRESDKAKGQDRIYIHGEIELESREKVLKAGIAANEKTLKEMAEIGKYTGAAISLLEYV
jgi:L-2-hydroxycarboxylate dehydrogenase (NAD+)